MPENRSGAIFIEVFLKYTASNGASAQSLGSLVLASSEDRHVVLDRPPVDEVLSFPFPPSVYGRQFDETTVAVNQCRRERVQARIAIRISSSSIANTWGNEWKSSL
jgi:hypothetical protein